MGRITLRQLLTMTAGLPPDGSADARPSGGDWVADILHARNGPGARARASPTPARAVTCWPRSSPRSPNGRCCPMRGRCSSTRSASTPGRRSSRAPRSEGPSPSGPTTSGLRVAAGPPGSPRRLRLHQDERRGHAQARATVPRRGSDGRANSWCRATGWRRRPPPP